jgi:alcohol dehydrogenase
MQDDPRVPEWLVLELRANLFYQYNQQLSLNVMKAARLIAVGSKLSIEDVPEPQLKRGSCRVKVDASHVMSYTHEIIEGHSGRIAAPIPYTMGLCAVGTIEAVAPDIVGLTSGQRVFCSPHVVAEPHGEDPEYMLIGWFGVSANAERLVAEWKNGAFAEKALYPSECITPIPDDIEADATQLSFINILAVAYGGLLRGGFRAGQTIIVNGATGNIGACAVVLSLAMGAARVIAVGRDEQILEQIAQLDSQRIVPVSIRADKEEYSAKIKVAANRAQLLLDAIAAPTADPTVACVEALGTRGTAVLMGGVRANFSLPYSFILRKELMICGSYMYPHSAIHELIQMIRFGVLNLSQFKISKYKLEDINQAVQDAPNCKGLAGCAICL